MQNQLMDIFCHTISPVRVQHSEHCRKQMCCIESTCRDNLAVGISPLEGQKGRVGSKIGL